MTVEQLDQQWNEQRNHLIRPGERLTTVSETIMRFAYCALIGLGFMIAAVVVWPHYTFGTLLLLPLMGRAIYLEARAHNYRIAEKDYFQKRQALLQQLQN